MDKKLLDILACPVTHQPLALLGGDKLKALNAAIAGGAMPEAIEHVHALKVRTGLLGMAEIHSIASSLEMALRNGEPPEETP